MHRFLPLAFLLFAACDGAVDNSFRAEYIVESYQMVGEALATVQVLRNAPVAGVFDRDALAVRDATVEVQLLRDDGSVEARYPYTHAGRDRYTPADFEATVRPLRRYRLEVRVPGFAPVISAETLTPDTFTFVSASADSATYGVAAEALTFNVTRPAYPGRQAVFIFSTETLLPELTLRDAVPFVRAFLDGNRNGIVDAEEDDAEGNEPKLEDLRVGSSPLINEKTYGLNPDGTLRIELPWIAVPFYGPDRVSASAVDDNLYDFLRSQAAQQGGSTLSPGEIPNVLDRVQNGAGLFASYSRVVKEVFIKRPDSDP